MTEKSSLWDIHTISRVTFTRVAFKEEVTLEEAIKLFKTGDFDFYEEAETSTENISEIIGAEAY